MTKKLPTAIALTLTFLLLSVSIIYACSGLAPLSATLQRDSMDGGMEEKGPCSQQKEDICKSVRDRMLSVRASSPAADITLHVSAILRSAPVEVPLLMNLLPTAGLPGVLFHPALNSSFPFSNRVLRI